jgi:hypothetical protein
VPLCDFGQRYGDILEGKVAPIAIATALDPRTKTLEHVGEQYRIVFWRQVLTAGQVLQEELRAKHTR